MAGYIGKGQPLVSNGAERKFKYVATAGQTVFNATYSVGSVHVYRTGVRLTDGVDYTATNGSTVTLTTGCNAGDDVVIVSTSGFQVADAYTKAESYSKTEVDGMIPTLSTLSIANHENIVVDSAGRVTMPHQPIAYITSYSNSSFPANVWTTVVGGNAVIDTANAYNSSTGTYTAPVTGTYRVHCSTLADMAGSAGYYRQCNVYVNGVAAQNIWHTQYNATRQYENVSGTVCLYLSANDAVTIRVNGSMTSAQYSGYHNLTIELVG